MILYLIWSHKEVDWNEREDTLERIYIDEKNAKEFMSTVELAELNEHGYAISDGYSIENMVTEDDIEDAVIKGLFHNLKINR
tara:strand:+ start:844 stop:1089 length:246 start_codon:yes stop_codon:yes gene_type:complete